MTHSLDIGAIVAATHNFRATLGRVKEDNPPEGFTWYGYDILSNTHHLDFLLKGENRQLFEKVGGLPIADIGAADGDLGYLFESLGFDVDIVDWPATNWNGLQGAAHLKELLGAKVDIHPMDLDSYFTPPRAEYGVALFLGILYHLKNPYYVMEKLARHARYTFVSTRVARYTTDRRLELAQAPVAYLLAPDECNNDATNYWIFSVPGLKRLFDRCGWDVVEFATVGDVENSNPSEPQRDERAFALLKSRHFA
ncbi:class I SAM-dependent methyltransferase [Tahibacter soli]|uniref:Class I SAM-dependent methyltransferase n=1 Tax=Tahibacter soli TaxID=2983605 RepID=A0A9X3YJN2_9GAMM|nr:class I SAM-dependent methyltransferase [Tahibacter soli]MDC8012038.1 class I SAM-dependent methyltransferase [Tahibacter soli]